MMFLEKNQKNTILPCEMQEMPETWGPRSADRTKPAGHDGLNPDAGFEITIRLLTEVEIY